MSFSESSLKKPKKLLIITCSGGGGLLQAANAKEQEARARDPEMQIIRRDVFRDWIWKPLGQSFINLWNGSQIRGYVGFQTFCVWGQLLVDRLFWPVFFVSALCTFFKEKVDLIIDTQNMATSAIVTALRIYNRRAKKQIQIHKVLVDLPTKKATHFFWPIKTLSKKNRKLIRIVTVAPLLEEGQTAEEFWQSNCKLSDGEILYEDVYVRQAFLKYKNKGKTASPMVFKLNAKNTEELQLMRKSYEKGFASGRIINGEVEFTIPPEDVVITVLLGSQPASDATLNYVKKCMQIAKEESGVRTHLFVFCSDHQAQEQTLFRKVSDYIVQIKDHPSHFSVIPFSFQNDEGIAPLFYRSDITCTRAGGQTAMELMCVGNGEIWIHSETKKSSKGDLPMEELLKGIPSWEAANALYLQKICGAKIVTPDTMGGHLKKVLQSDVVQASSNHSSVRLRGLRA